MSEAKKAAAELIERLGGVEESEAVVRSIELELDHNGQAELILADSESEINEPKSANARQENSNRTRADKQKYAPRKILELRQVQGSGDGSALRLTPGEYNVGPKKSGQRSLAKGTPDLIAFRLVVSQSLQIELFPEALQTFVDGELVIASTKITNQIISAGSTDFKVVPMTRKPKKKRSKSRSAKENKASES